MATEVLDKKYEWVDFYRQTVFPHILSYEEKQTELAHDLKSFKKEVGHNFRPDKILGENGLIIDDPNHHTEIDPFTVLALINVGTNENRKKLHSLLLSKPIDIDLVGVAESDAQSVWFYPYKVKKTSDGFVERPKDTVSKLWKLFKQVIAIENNNLNQIKELIVDILPTEALGINKLTTGLYRCRPDIFFPLNSIGTKFLAKNKIQYTDVSVENTDKALRVWENYCNTLNEIQNNFENQNYYELYYQAVQDLDKMENYENQIEKDESLNVDQDKNRNLSKKFPLNQILYGPAGTGKTYNTINYALSILDGRDPEKQQTKDDRDKFKKYMAEGRISFVTFHQSYGYEDFVEGIKVVPENNQLTYPVIPGIFKKICQLASANVKSNISEKFDLGNRAIWKMSLGRAGIEDDLYRSCLDNDVVLLGWGDSIDFTGCNDLQSINHKLAEFDYPINQLDTASSYVNTFKNKIKNGDLVVITDGNLKFRAIAEVIGEYEYDSEQEFSYYQVRKVKWLKSFSPSLNNEDYFKKIFSQSTVYNLENAVDKEKIQRLLTLEKTEKSDIDDKFVLIIDEINRGNISKIFGELITLIEESKRVGNAEALEIILPNSPNVKFGVPKNLYIIGTMNSSDRSLTSVDIALRRRFEFIEMMPKSEILKDIKITKENEVVEAIDVDKVLDVMNKRIKVLLDRDHCIGHAYFTELKPTSEKATATVQELMQVFEKRIIPLLQEYFFDDWSKINLVLGNNGMVKTEKLEKSLFPSMDDQLIGNFESRNWEVNIKLFKGNSEEDKINAINKIIGIEAKNNIKVVESAESA